MVLDEIYDLIDCLSKKNGSRRVANSFGKEKKWIYSVKNGCTIKLNAEFIAGLKEYGYELKLCKINENNNKKMDKEIHKNV